MSVSRDELMYLQSQLEGLESIFLELMPFGVGLKRHDVQEFYNKRLDHATKPAACVAEGELRRQFNTKANQVRNLVDSAESLGDVTNKLNLIRAAASLPDDRKQPLKGGVGEFCQKLINEETADQEALDTILNNNEIGSVEARVLLASAMFLITNEVNCNGGKMAVADLLNKIMDKTTKGLLSRNDPFLVEAQCALEALHDED